MTMFTRQLETLTRTYWKTTVLNKRNEFPHQVQRNISRLYVDGLFPEMEFQQMKSCLYFCFQYLDNIVEYSIETVQENTKPSVVVHWL